MPFARVTGAKWPRGENETTVSIGNCIRSQW